MKKYNPKLIEKKWQKFWEENEAFEVKEDAKKEKFYSLTEFPYPSGEGLHVGHPRPFTAMDVISRKKRMEGKNVLFPIGFDSFGLPTENYAIKTGKPPAEVTKKNIANFTRQLKMLGYSFDWSRQVDTSDPKYYKWTQWLFLQFFKHGLAYKKKMPINWCLKCKIGLANEEVVDGNCERGGGPVEKRDKEQWMLAITKYADKLLDGLKNVDYIERAKVQQENWIGRSEGASIKFIVIPSEARADEESLSQTTKGQRTFIQVQDDKTTIEVFTTRPDTLFGATYMVVAPEHFLIEKLKPKIKNWDEVKKYIDQARKKTDLERTELQKEKTGVELKGIKAINPATNEEIPVWVADYVLASYGTGAIMAVPAHDERDWEFAKKFGLPAKFVVAKQVTEVLPGSKEVVATRGIIIKNGKILITKDVDRVGAYVLLGGRIDDGETDLRASLVREIKEETGYINFTIKDYLGQINNSYYSERLYNQNVHRKTHGFVVELINEKKDEKLIKKGECEIHWLDTETAKNEITKTKLKGEEEFIGRALNKSLICFAEEGVAINSEFLNELTTPEAKEKIIRWLEEKGVGKKQVQYKLRDWVFSRQRYWGEPIPLVHCETCAEKKYNYIIIHGFNSSSKRGFKPWLKDELEKRGYRVWNPDLPNASEPQVAEQVQFILDNAPFSIDKDTIVVGHSLGGAVVYKLLERVKSQIAKAILVDPVYKPEYNDKPRPAVLKSTDWKFDWQKIKNHANEFVVVGDKNFPIIKEEHLRELSLNLSCGLWMVNPSVPHFSSSDKQDGSVTVEPAVLDACVETGWIPLPEKELPLELPKVKKYQPTDSGESPLAAIEKWVKTKCPKCGGPARRETDTMPNWAGSSWYFLRYCDPCNDKEFASMEKLEYWMGHPTVIPTTKEESLSQPMDRQRSLGGVNPTRDDKNGGGVDWYNGGMEHTVLHLLYSRFWNIFLHDIGLVPTSEPYKKRTSHGMILAPDGEKMSKSRGNVVNPDEMVEKFGADALRAYIMFMGPFDQAVAWDTNGLVGVRRFLDKVWGLQEKVTVIPNPRHIRPAQCKLRGEESLSQPTNGQSSLVGASLARDDNKKIETMLHQTIKKVGDDIDNMRLNTAIAKMMELVNEMSKAESISNIQYSMFIKLLFPFVPHMCEELWGLLGNKKSLAFESWPEYNPKLAKESEITLAVQVNGKLRDTLTVSADISEDEAKKLVLAGEKVQKWLEGKEPKKVIYIKGKLVSIVV